MDLYLDQEINMENYLETILVKVWINAKRKIMSCHDQELDINFLPRLSLSLDPVIQGDLPILNNVATYLKNSLAFETDKDM